MAYGLYCSLSGPVVGYQLELIDAIAETFGLNALRTQNIEPHFTLKYDFEATPEQHTELESMLEHFCQSHSSAPVTITGFGHFFRDVFFLEVQASTQAQLVIQSLNASLRTLPWMRWNPFDDEGLHLHATIAGPPDPVAQHFEKIQAWLEGREFRFETRLDNITLLESTREHNGITFWQVCRRFRLA